MSTTPPAQQPRRRVWRWVAGLGLGALVVVWAWKEVLRNQAASELRAAGFDYSGRADLWQVARQDWRGLFKRETWSMGSFAGSSISSEGGNRRNLDVVGPALRRLKITEIVISGWDKLENVDALKGVPLKHIQLVECETLQNIDGLKCQTTLGFLEISISRKLRDVEALRGLTQLSQIELLECTALENVDALHGLAGLQQINLQGCTKLSPEAVASLKAALPNTFIYGPDGAPVSNP